MERRLAHPFHTARHGTQNGRSCQIREDLIGADYLPLETAPFLRYLGAAIDAAARKHASGPAGVGACGLERVESIVTCPPLKASQVRKWEKENAQAAAKGKPLPWPGQFERDNYRKRFEVVARVSGYGLNTNVDVRKLASVIRANVNHRLRQEYTKGFKCNYAVTVETVAATATATAAGKPDSAQQQLYKGPQTRYYSTMLVDAVLQPDGYNFPGTFYTDTAGNSQMLGPTVESFEGDQVNFEIMNMGMMGQSTHCEWSDGMLG